MYTKTDTMIIVARLLK